ncbi:uncharacterized protein BXZ73DRAFT_57927 [Epithele typhae]|uniref:uncharacterized protein n=1 Tax=Epithele typhae TaxID=378194 RepID=UPI00200757B0|nr:uncharacterized protein BXZ73DRAFT_57927 [Epithele typhae]KAH9910661.1 hypothetical protein BXZ73DRAFT_57927 [Epithele typhae]
MPPRSKRNASRRQHPSAQPTSYDDSLASYSPSPVHSINLGTPNPPPNLLSFEPEAPPYPSPSPAVFELEPPPSDPEAGRASAAIRDAHLFDDDPGFAYTPDRDHDRDMYVHHEGASESDIDDGGPASTSTSPPGPSSLGNHFAVSDEPSPRRSGLSKLASAAAAAAAAEDTTDDDSSLARSVGHIRAPVLARDPTPLETFSRTIRNYVPSSIPIPSAAPSPPRVSRPVSFGSFLSPSAPTAPVLHAASPPPSSPEWRRPVSGATQSRGHRSSGEMPVFSLDDDVLREEEPERRATRYPGVGDTESILWAGWDTLSSVIDGSGETPKSRSVLMLGYPSGVQIWDCLNLGSVSELLNLTGAQWGAVEFAGVLPDITNPAEDEFRQKRPLIGFSSRTAQGTDFVVYSLRSHEVVHRLPVIGLTSFAASSQFIVLCTSNPSTLTTISACTLATLYTISSTSLNSFAYPPSYTSPVTSHNNNASFNDLSHLDLDKHFATSAPRPIYALSNRLLAYVAPLTRPEPIPIPTPGQAHTSSPVPALDAAQSAGKFGLNISQAELGSAAVKIGGSMLSGMKTLGGMAFSAARAGVNAAVEQGAAHARSTSAGGSGANGFGLFFSKSAPAATASPHEYQTAADRRRRSLRISPVNTATNDGLASPTPTSTGFLPPSASSPGMSSAGSVVVIVDLRSLLGAAPGTEPEPIAQFAFAKAPALSALKFSDDGTSIAVCSKDGHAVRVFQIKPTPRSARIRALSSTTRREPDSTKRTHDRPSVHPIRRASSSSDAGAEHLAESVQHVYTLRRGRTSAIVEGVEWANDKAWFAMSSRKRTIHVYAVNPMGGKPDGAGHLMGRVGNLQELAAPQTELPPLVRVRLKQLPQDARSVPVAFTFVRGADGAVPSSLLPPAAVHFSASSSPSSVTSSGFAKPVSPAQRPTRPTNYKDLLVFDPNDGTLALHRIFVERAAVDTAVVPGSIPVAGGMSISLPGVGTLRNMGMVGMSASPPSPRVASGLTQMMERGTEIVGRETVVGTWALARGGGWPEVRQVLRSGRAGSGTLRKLPKADWLSRAELSTCSSSPKLLPRLIYLSHQFSFYALSEDYHALIRSAHLDVPARKIDVRKPIEVSAFATGDGDAFVQGLPAHAHHDIGGRAPSSFDEPLASALSGPLPAQNPSPPVLPMLPNGTPGSASRSLINAIPIRQVAAGLQDGMSEGIGRIRRELGKARSPKLVPQHRRDSVPLEFDEEDEDFAVNDVQPVQGLADSISRSTSMGTVSSEAHTPSAPVNLDPLPVDQDADGQTWSGWGPEDQKAVEDAERFDEITVGFMDEEHETIRQVEAKASAKKAPRVGKKKRDRRTARDPGLEGRGGGQDTLGQSMM